MDDVGIWIMTVVIGMLCAFALRNVSGMTQDVDEFTICLGSESAEHQEVVTLEPLHASPAANWRALGVVHLPSAVGRSEFHAIDQSRCPTDMITKAMTPASGAWPTFDASAAVLLATAERLVRQLISEPYVSVDAGVWQAPHLQSRQHSSAGGHCGSAPGVMQVCAYHYAYRDTLPTSGATMHTVPVMHADNVFDRDAMRDFAPVLHDMVLAIEAVRDTYGTDEASATIGSLFGGGGSSTCSMGSDSVRNMGRDSVRDTALCAVARGEKAMVRGFNVWILLEDDGRDAPSHLSGTKRTFHRALSPLRRPSSLQSSLPSPPPFSPQSPCLLPSTQTSEYSRRFAHHSTLHASLTSDRVVARTGPPSINQSVTKE